MALSAVKNRISNLFGRKVDPYDAVLKDTFSDNGRVPVKETGHLGPFIARKTESSKEAQQATNSSVCEREPAKRKTPEQMMKDWEKENGSVGKAKWNITWSELRTYFSQCRAVKWLKRTYKGIVDPFQFRTCSEKVLLSGTVCFEEPSKNTELQFNMPRKIEYSLGSEQREISSEEVSKEVSSSRRIVALFAFCGERRDGNCGDFIRSIIHVDSRKNDQIERITFLPKSEDKPYPTPKENTTIVASNENSSAALRQFESEVGQQFPPSWGLRDRADATQSVEAVCQQHLWNLLADAELKQTFNENQFVVILSNGAELPEYAITFPAEYAGQVVEIRPSLAVNPEKSIYGMASFTIRGKVQGEDRPIVFNLPETNYVGSGESSSIIRLDFRNCVDKTKPKVSILESKSRLELSEKSGVEGQSPTGSS